MALTAFQKARVANSASKQPAVIAANKAFNQSQIVHAPAGGETAAQKFARTQRNVQVSAGRIAPGSTPANISQNKGQIIKDGRVVQDYGYGAQAEANAKRYIDSKGQSFGPIARSEGAAVVNGAPFGKKYYGSQAPALPGSKISNPISWNSQYPSGNTSTAPGYSDATGDTTEAGGGYMGGSTGARPILDGTSSQYMTDMPEAPKSLAEIRADQLSQAQSAIDATAALFTEQQRQINVAGASQLAQTSSNNVGAGLAGSPFAQTNEAGVQQNTQYQLNAQAAQRSADISGIMQQAEANSQNLYQQGVENYRSDRDFAVSERDSAYSRSRLEAADAEAKQEAAKKSSQDTILNLAKAGYSLDEMNPQEYKALLAKSGMTDFEAHAIWAASSPEANAEMTVQNGMIVQTYFDPHTGKPVVKTTPLPPELAGAATPPDIGTQVLGDGSVLFYDKNNPLDENGNLRTIKYKGSDITKPVDGSSWNGSTVSTLGRLKDSKYLTDAGKLADDFSQNPAVKGFATQQEGLGYASTYDVNTTNPYESQALIFGFMKVLDPTSVVREGEYATAQKNTSLLGQLGIKLDNISGVKVLTPEQSQQIVDAIKTRYTSAESAYNNIVSQYSSRASSFGIDPEDVVTNYGIDFGSQDGGGDTGAGGFDVKSFIDDARASGTSDQEIYQNLIDNGDYTPPENTSVDPKLILDQYSSGSFPRDLSMSQNGSPLEIAKSYLGLNASDPKQAKTLSAFFKKAGGVDVDPATTAWCAAFANSVLGASGIKGTGSLMARSFLNFGTAVDKPTKGDIVVFERGAKGSGLGHVGFVVGINENGTLQVLGGNQSGKTSIETFKTGKVLGYRRINGIS